MPLGKKLRPSSATAKLESHAVTSILDEIHTSAAKVPVLQRASTALGGRRTAAHPLVSNGRRESHDQSHTYPEWLEKELLKWKQRSYSIGLAENIAENENVQYHGDPTRSLRKGKIEQHVTLEHLQKLKAAFEEFESRERKFLDEQSFKQIVKKCLGLRTASDEQIGELFMKIDYSAKGAVQWDAFCTYMQLEYTEKEESSARLKEVAFTLPATIKEISHGEPVLRICSTPDNNFIIVREDGTIYFYTSELKLKWCRAVFEKTVNRKPKWITDYTIMTHYNKFILGTGDREIQLYELSTFEPYCQISGLETVPLRLDYCLTGPDECMILYGDDKGCVNILQLTSVGETLRTWKKLPKAENLPNIGIENAALSPNVTYVRWKVHEDWVTQLKYYDSITAVISSSNHEPTGLVIGCTVGGTNIEQQLKEVKDSGKEGKGRRGLGAPGLPQKRSEDDQTVFRVYKGVKTFSFCKTNNLLVTGGMDRTIRMWNPYVPGKPTGLLRGHTAPVVFLQIVMEDKRIFSVSTDSNVKIWDIQDQTCLFTANPKASRIRGDITACHYAPGVKALCIATDSIALLSLKIKPQPQSDQLVSHKEPVLCCGFNKAFRQVVSCTEGSAIKVWDLESGKQVFEFGGAHGDSAITCMTFDTSGRRLVTGGRDGCLKIWNYNNGHCLRILRPVDSSEEVCDCTYVEMNKNRYIMSVGWDRRINIYSDSVNDLYHIQGPQPYWQDDLKRGHKEDILCISQCPPTLLATSSYDGEIIVWNMVSGHIYCRLHTPTSTECRSTKSAEKNVNKVVFLKTRALKLQSAASLVSCGPQGSVNFWNLFNGGRLFATLKESRVKFGISTLTVNKDDTSLYVADHAGFVYVYNISSYSLHGPEVESPKNTNHWRAHLSTVTSLKLIEEDRVLLTSSTDCTVRLWSMDGEFIGTFGQPEPWALFTSASWKHPMIPYEILIDPLSMPVHPLLEHDESDMQISNPTQHEENNKKSSTKPELNISQRLSQLNTTDDDIKQEIESHTYPQILGKRLQHERFRNLNKPLNHGGPNAYHTLKYYDLVNPPFVCEKPDLSAAGTDPFIHYHEDNDSV
ncbi:WD repeat-containing protein 49-like [Protopterus annectens]|uniref:WD repeat-containing protein 49-like n=1 Tax=Protopterus annectens TaxID=7888 RepID=UPI001CF9CF35|nr:WD repeat-containing protein 49-like [Protopterus annectens]